jgi:hypothetical protein
MSETGLLLLDLDGVVVFESGPPLLADVEILRLHEMMVDRLAEFEAPVVVLTHRSRVEARRILQSAGIDAEHLAGVMAAEDLMSAALLHGNLRQLLSRGLRKSLILPLVEKRFGVKRSSMALLDDRVDNLEDLIAAGLGFALHAPSDTSDDRALITFDIGEAIIAFTRWKAAPEIGRFESLTPIRVEIEPWRCTGLCTKRVARHPFNALRSLARRIRQAIGKTVAQRGL